MLMTTVADMRQAEIRRLDLGNLNPIYERELDQPDVHQPEEGEVECVERRGEGQRMSIQATGGRQAHCRGVGILNPIPSMIRNRNRQELFNGLVTVISKPLFLHL